MSGPTRQRVPQARALNLNKNVKRTLNGGRFGGWMTYRTPGKPKNPTGYDGPRVVISERGVYLASITIYLVSTAPNPRFVQLFDTNGGGSGQFNPIIEGQTWNPDFIFRITPGNPFTFIPPRERASSSPAGFETMDSGNIDEAYVVREDDGGYPFNHGIMVVDSVIDTDIQDAPANEIRINARMLSPWLANVGV